MRLNSQHVSGPSFIKGKRLVLPLIIAFISLFIFAGNALADNLTIDDVTLAEGNAGTVTFTFTVTRAGTGAGAVSVQYQTNNGSATVLDGDYVAASGTLNFADSEMSKTIDVTVNGDTKVEGDEGFTVTLFNPVGITISDNTGDGTITNDDAATLAINDVTHNEGNAGGTTYTFTVTLTGDVDQAFTVDYATADNSATTADNDYTAVAATALNFAGTNGETQTFNITVNGDTKVEADESFFVNLSNVQAGGKNVTISDAQGVGTITNDDTATLTIVGVTQNEGSGGGTTNFDFTVTLDNNVQGGFDLAFTVNNGTATAADDFSVFTASPITFAGTATETQTIRVQVNADSKVEADEAFTVTLGALSNIDPTAADDIGTAGSPATGTITNDDAATISIDDVTQHHRRGKH